MATVIFHIGLPKTATTTLQNYLFHQLNTSETINFIGRKGESGDKDYYNHFSEILWAIITNDDQTFEQNSAQYLEFINQHIVDDRINVVSEEVLSISYGEFDVMQNLQRIHKLLQGHDVKILIALRKQEEIIYSFFIEFLNHRLLVDPENNILQNYIANGLSQGENGHFLMFHYDVILSKIAELYGEKNLYVTLFEDISKNPERYAETLAELLNIEVSEVTKHLHEKKTNIKTKNHIGYQPAPISLDKHMIVFFKKHSISKYIPAFLSNKFSEKLLKEFLRMFRKIKVTSKPIPYLTDDEKKTISKAFQDGNKLIDRQYHLNLKEYGYYS